MFRASVERLFIVEDHPETLSFVVAIDDQIGAPAAWQFTDPAALTARRQYVTAVVRQRLHQRGFRQRVLRAYQQCCAICRLRHDELLEAPISSRMATRSVSQ